LQQGRIFTRGGSYWMQCSFKSKFQFHKFCHCSVHRSFEIKTNSLSWMIWSKHSVIVKQNLLSWKYQQQTSACQSIEVEQFSWLFQDSQWFML
jgi:hypothetical protein